MTEHWIIIERENSNNLMVGPYETGESAVHAMENSNLIEGFCQEDSLECYVTDTADTPANPLSEGFNIVHAELDNPDHTGVGEVESETPLRIMSYVEEEGNVHPGE